MDTHIVLVPSPGDPIPTPTPSPFDGKLMQNLSTTAMIDNMPVGKPLVRNGDVAETCNDPVDAPKGQVVASSSVKVG